MARQILRDLVVPQNDDIVGPEPMFDGAGFSREESRFFNSLFSRWDTATVVSL